MEDVRDAGIIFCRLSPPLQPKVGNLRSAPLPTEWRKGAMRLMLDAFSPLHSVGKGRGIGDFLPLSYGSSTAFSTASRACSVTRLRMVNPVSRLAALKSAAEPVVGALRCVVVTVSTP
jgi:hypothetical protein